MMNNWNYDKLEQMNNAENEFTSIKLNYVFIAENFEEMYNLSRKNADLMPLEFDDVKLAYDGDIFKDIDIVEVSDEVENILCEKERERNVVHIKHFSRDLSHEDWFKFIDDEVLNFIKKYPQFEDALQK